MAKLVQFIAGILILGFCIYLKAGNSFAPSEREVQASREEAMAMLIGTDVETLRAEQAAARKAERARTVKPKPVRTAATQSSMMTGKAQKSCVSSLSKTKGFQAAGLPGKCSCAVRAVNDPKNASAFVSIVVIDAQLSSQIVRAQSLTDKANAEANRTQVMDRVLSRPRKYSNGKAFTAADARKISTSCGLAV